MKSTEYFSFESVSPYSTIDSSRFSNTKQVFKSGANIMVPHVSGKSSLRILDVGCANGEFLHYLMSSTMCRDISQRVVKAEGIDITQKFIDVAQTLSIPNTSFNCCDLFDFTIDHDGFDVVTCFGSVPIFKDPTLLFNKLFTLLKDDGILICDGLYNKSNISVEVRFRDDSIEATRGIWRSDFNQHGYAFIQEIFAKLGQTITFTEIEFDVDIPRNMSAPAINVWTQTLESGMKQVVNGANWILNPTMLTMIKNSD